MRVIAGSARGVPLVAPRGTSTRPITDRVKETLFAILADRVPDARVPRSVRRQRGDRDRGPLARCGERRLRGARPGCADGASPQPRAHAAREGGRVHAVDVERFLADDGGPWDLAFLDPPYEVRDIVAPLRALVPRLAPGASVVIKHFWRTELPVVDGLEPARERRFGETTLSFWDVERA